MILDMTQKILVEGWDDLSLQEQEAVQAWLKGILDAWFAKQKFLDIYCFRDCQNLEFLTPTLLQIADLTLSKDDYMFVSSASDEEGNIINVHDIIKLTTSELSLSILTACQECLNRCGKHDIPCRKECRKNECNR